MGMTKYAFIGPYIELPDMKEMQTVKKRHCTNIECVSHKRETAVSFCPECGSKIETHTESEWREMSWHDVVYNAIGEDDCFWLITGCTEKSLINSNHVPDISLSEEEMIDITPELIQKKIKEFRDFHKDDIAKLELFCSQKIEVKFGAIEYYM